MKDKRQVQAVIFDLGNVLLDFDHTLAAKRIACHCKKTPKEIFNLFFDSKITGQFEEGKISPGGFFREVKNMLGLEMDYRGFLPIWNEIFFFSEKNRAVHKIALSLKKRYKVTLLSNVNTLHFDYIRKHFPVFDAFHHIVTSFESGLRKPHPRLYEKALKIMGVMPEEAFYTDDRPELVKEASRLGIRAYVFKDAGKLKDDLGANGISFLEYEN